MKFPQYADTKELIFFSHLYQTRILADAAKKTGISSSTASKLLKSLRERFDDELFVRSNPWMYPTEKAKSLYPALCDVVTALNNFHHVQQTLTPEEMTREFRVLAADLMSPMIFSAAAEIFDKYCPNSSMQLRTLSENYLDLLAAEDDIAIFTPVGELPRDYETLDLLEARDVVLLRKNHPLMRQKDIRQRMRDLGEYRKADLLFEFRSAFKEFSSYDSYVETEEQKASVSGSFAWGMIPALLTSTCTMMMPDMAAAQAVRWYPELTYFRVPMVDDKPWKTKMIWHRRLTKDPALVWFKAMLAEGIRKRAAALS